jgi:hypothetical protein
VEGGKERELVCGVTPIIYWVRKRSTPSDLVVRYGVGRLIEVTGDRHVGTRTACGSDEVGEAAT